ncbi:MAG: nucleotidyltransferase family protein [bacterium]|nr:nucleotidyltransferase family protein [bacterium]
MTRAIILAGGKGERMSPITLETPKILIPIHGRTLLDQSLDLYYKHSVFEIWLSLGHKWQEITAKYPFPFILETSSRGTGGWLKIVKGIPESLALFTEDFYVNNGDNLLEIDLKKMMEDHKRNGNVVTIACVKVPDVRDYGSVIVKQGKITRFKEKQNSPKPKQGFINSGFYIFNPKIFDYVPNLEPNSAISLERDIFPKLARANLLGAFPVTGQWFDTGTVERYKTVLEQWKGGI